MREMTTIRLLALAPLSLALAACGDDAVPDEAATSDADATARGEVLGGEISDEMLPLDQLRSQSPAAPRANSTGSGSSSASSSNDSDINEPSEPESEEADAPEEAPAPEASDEGDE